MPGPALTILNTYDLEGSPAAFAAAIAALAKRVEAEGHPGVLSYRFFVGKAGKARAVIDYETPEAWIGHHDSAMGWPEMKVLHTVAKLTDVVFLGPMTDAIARWLAGSGLTARVESGYAPVAGFQRA